MSILTKHLPLVKEQEAFHAKMAQAKANKPFAANLHKATSEKLHALAIDLEMVDALLEVPPSPPAAVVPKKLPGQLSLSLEDIENLPDELIAELNLTDGDKAEFAIMNALEDAGGVITLDRLLIALYLATGEIHKRTALTNRLYRMTSKGRIFSVPGRKGVYTAEQLSTADAAALFGTVKPEALEEKE